MIHFNLSLKMPESVSETSMIGIRHLLVGKRVKLRKCIWRARIGTQPEMLKHATFSRRVCGHYVFVLGVPKKVPAVCSRYWL